MASKRSPKNSSIALLRAVNKFLSSLDQNEVDDIIGGRTEIALKASAPDQLFKPDMADQFETRVELQRIIDELSASASMQTAVEALRSARLSKADLEFIARRVDVPIARHDSISRLEEKILEALVGARLNSKAIRGNDKGSK